MYIVAGPFTGTSSIYGRVTCGISCCRIWVTSSLKIGTELVHLIGNVVRRNAPNGVWNVVRSRDDVASARLSYPTCRSIILLHARPANCSASWSVNGGTPEWAIVTLLSGSKDCTIRKDFPS